MPAPQPVRPHAREPFVTIAIPTYNRAQFLKGCVTSALSQEYENFEVLVSDNASTDATEHILQQFHDRRLRILRQETNIGLLPNWNACLAHARGDYVVVVSDDDIVAPWLLERCASLAALHPQLPIVIALSDLHLASTGQTLPARLSPHLRTGLHDGSEILLAYLRNEIGVVATCGVMLRTDSVRSVGGFPLAFPHTADVAAWTPLLFMGKAGLVNEACATWYSHDGSETARLRTEQLLSDGWSMAELISRLAGQHLRDSVLRHRIQAEARRCFANRGLTMLAEHRRKGGDLREILELIWRHRRHFREADIRALLKLAAVVLCPRPIARRARRVKQAAGRARHDRAMAQVH
jgi:glycosyltransferase involved in cell wall biosynthesis